MDDLLQFYLRVRLIPDISAKSLKDHKANELSLWYCLRAINHWGSVSSRYENNTTIPFSLKISGGT